MEKANNENMVEFMAPVGSLILSPLDSGEKSIRLFLDWMLKTKFYSEREMDDAYDKGFKDGMIKYRE